MLVGVTVLATCWLCKSVSLNFPESGKTHMQNLQRLDTHIHIQARTEASCFSTALKNSKCLRMAR